MKGKDDSWTELMPPLRRFIRRHIRDGQDAEDLLQEAAVRIESHRDQMPADEQRLPWALRIARNLIIDQRRAAQLRRHAPLEADVATVTTPAVTIQKMELGKCIKAMIDKLPEPYGQALRLADLEGMDQQTIARQMNLSPSGARSRVQRARQQLHRKILDCCHLERNARGDVIDYQPREHARKLCDCAADNRECHGNSCVTS